MWWLFDPEDVQQWRGLIGDVAASPPVVVREETVEERLAGLEAEIWILEMRFDALVVELRELVAALIAWLEGMVGRLQVVREGLGK